MTADATTPVTTDATTRRRRFATAAMVGVIAYVAVDVVLQFLLPHYSAVRDAESNLAVGPFGWIMNLNFLGRAATTACAILAIRRVGRSARRRTVGVSLLAAGGAASALLAFFPTDVAPAGGAGEDGVPVITHTSVGIVHLTVATVGFVAALAAVLVLTSWVLAVCPGRAPHGRATRRAAIGFAALATVGLVALGLSFTVTPWILGLAERICLVGILGWTFVVCAGIRHLPDIGRL
ncbi:DUF998 domain-containing protein [Glaciibacter sp. 2TAF33]|uniref:DUF998 domain-containing protein n=1 Tax=Glaciibacter sp. 2TAF33 TaxID=3233015 RepID=UPI003F915BF2